MMPLPDQTRFNLKAVCSNPRHKREKFVPVYQIPWLNESRLAPVETASTGARQTGVTAQKREASALLLRTISQGESIRSISNGS
jgi:hypothetical protein